ncbi:MAG: ABC transporter permease [Solirubrobacterales bacterium]|nr:ABC transporter permease [Solirubrobacterales bacterium]MBV9915369.1 ABC transporter permease [Solirubrobacterales bacterium]
MTERGVTGEEPPRETLSSERELPGGIAVSDATAAEIYGEEVPAARAAKTAPGASKLVTFLWALPGTVWLILFLVAPVIVVLVVSFFTGTITGFSKTWTTDNYTTIFSSTSQYLDTLGKVARNAAIVTVVCLLIGYPVAYFLAVKVKKVQYSFALFIIALAPFFTSTLIRVESWIPTMGEHGAVNEILTKIGLINHPLSILLFSDFAVSVALVQLLVLFMVTPIFFQLAALDQSAIEAARDLGASGWKVFLHVTLPLTRAGIMIGSVFVFVLAMGDFGTYRLIGGGKVGSIGVNISNLVSLLQYPQAAAQAAVLVVAMVIGVVLLLRFAKLEQGF